MPNRAWKTRVKNEKKKKKKEGSNVCAPTGEETYALLGRASLSLRTYHRVRKKNVWPLFKVTQRVRDCGTILESLTVLVF